MKITLLILFFLCCGIINGQISSYNKGLKRTTIILNGWYLNKGIETFTTKQTPVGYKQSYDELKNVLSHYNLSIMEAEVDESLIDKSVEGLRDFQNLSNSLLIEWSIIKMAWRTNDKYQVYWGCNNEINLILIQKIK
ncbi:hypothetical protein SGQ44_13610 [Flavobacterium sp. Fl-77]|uniref:Uncharacterized protein n=1 Tax=Flavobacterium flavipigmentatum TaxID=2893884 RepID=A0AAJ2SCV5_9FLAO|nr:MULTISPECIES: hypothetical protein [unclassified Flavobacterium]MDX6183132.1 hypothetical protein [Flavobacterium sp. Fl-33]MDX6186799.1 hypothetical protein [Flavobacterium sp. Fl-77]UFH40453.1 hypothetical protein LNP22_09290 [Flavobacterium sp. F-70]